MDSCVLSPMCLSVELFAFVLLSAAFHFFVLFDIGLTEDFVLSDALVCIFCWNTSFRNQFPCVAVDPILLQYVLVPDYVFAATIIASFILSNQFVPSAAKLLLVI